MRAVSIGLAVGGLLLVGSLADAQVANSSTQIKPRVLLMVDTSGSMTEHFTDISTTGGDGSTFYSDKLMTRSLGTDGNLSLYSGYELGTTKSCPSISTTQFDGVNSRMYAAKQAVSNVVNGAGNIDWGLMRYSGTQCSVVDTTSNTNGSCTTGNDDTCATGQFCIGGRCVNDDNLCFSYYVSNNGETAGYGSTRHGSGGGNPSCSNRTGGVVSYTGGSGTPVAADNALCATPQVCYSDADCNGGTAGSCVALPNSAAKACICTGSASCDGTIFKCDTNADTYNGYCLYHEHCVNPGGSVIVDPSVAGSNSAILPWVDGIEALPNNLAGVAVNPELRASNGTPLAGAARSATTWYKSVIGSDTKSQCRPYVLIQMTDGYDSGNSEDVTNGPVAAAGSFVAATVSGAKVLNKVYVIGLAFGGNSNPTLDAIAHVGGTGTARLAGSQQEIQSALADIVSSSVLHEICNGIDDNCNGQCDEDFPDVAVSATAPDGSTCSNPHPANTCDNGLEGQCYAVGQFACSADKLSEVCVTPTCNAQTGATVSSPGANTMRLSNVTGIGAANIGQILFVSGSAKVANNGGFLITAVPSGTTVDLSNSGVVVPDASVVTYAIPPTQGKATPVATGGNVTLTVTAGSTTGLAVGATIYVLGAANAGNNGQFTITGVTSTTITYANAGGVTSVTPLEWAVNICKGTETCNGIDDDCDGIIDNCGNATPGSCCTSNCPACAKPPYIETCNNCDDDCDGVIDDHLVDTGLSCGNNVGDCGGGTTMCCSSDPNAGACTINGTTDKIYCKSGNVGVCGDGTTPGFPVAGADCCDGTDDNCNGVPNDEAPKACFTDGTNTLPAGKDGVGVCHHGTESCLTLPLCGTSGQTPPSCIVGACPAGWPAGKTCPNPTPSYGSCQGLVAPSTEFCDGLDNDCDGCIDNNPQDAWIGTACCSTGNLADCDNTGTGTRCHRGTWQCAQPGGACTAGTKSCVGSVAKSTEICDGMDDDCDGVVDDVPGVGAPCTGPGIVTGGECKAVMECVAGNTAPQCVQTVGPMPEVCNGKDDNCNGQIDDNNPPLAQNPLPGVGVPCDVPVPPLDHPPCMPGATVCQAGMIVCVGAVGPMPNQCNGISTDCTGNPNTNGNCPTGFQCYQGNCVAPCDTGEFPCPGGYACNTGTTACDINGVHTGCCVPDACAQKTCPPGENCQIDSMGNAQCVDPCATVTCPASYVCKLGTCVDGSCRTQGCPDGQICVNDPSSNTFACQPDPCANVMCDANQFCQNGTCVNICQGPCPKGQYCSGGQCVPDPCATTPCVEGQVCQIDPTGTPVCVEDQCQFGCDIGQACCGGQCVADVCENLHCPEDTHCTLTPDCAATCETNPASPKDQVVGAGGGGFGCAVAGPGSPSSSSSLAWLIVVAGALLFRRRRAAEVRK